MAFRSALLALAWAWVLAARHLPIQIFTTAQGLPRNQVSCMVFSPTGVLWVCTSEGLARFDGYHFQLFGPDQGLPSRRILDLIPSRKGGYWLVSNAGLCRLAPTAKVGQPCRLLDLENHTGDLFADALLESDSGNTWFSIGSAVYRVSADERKLQLVPFEVPPRQRIISLADGLNGDILVGTDFEVFSLHPGDKPQSVSREIGSIGAIDWLRLPSGEVLIGATNGLFRMSFHDGHYSFLRITTPGMNRVNVVMRRHDGTTWVGGGGGIRRLSFDAAGNITPEDLYTLADGLPSEEITWLAEDSRGNLWGATEGTGIFRIADAGFITYYKNDGLGPIDRIASVLQDGDGRVVVETSWGANPTFAVRDGGTFKRVPVPHPSDIHYFGWGWNQLATRAHDGEWWIPTGQGLLHFPRLSRVEDLAHAVPRVLDGKSPLGCNEIFRAFEDAAGDVWISCVEPKHDVIRWQRASGNFQHFGADDGWLPEAVAMVFRQSPSGAVWVGTGSSAFRFRNGKFERFQLTPGKVGPGVRDLLVDHMGRIWVATDFAGLFRCDNPDDPAPTFQVYTVREGLSTNSVQTVLEDVAGFIYAGTARHVDRIDPGAPFDSHRIRHFTSADGLPDSQLTTGFRDARGHLWFGSLRGLAEFDPTKAPRHPPPPIYVMRLRVRGEEAQLPWEGAQQFSLDLASDRNQVEIEYAGIDPGSAGSLMYQYRLVGVDRDWSPPIERLSVNYASLPSGPFRFEVRAVDADGQVSPSPATVDLSIAAPVWRRWWFLLTLVTVLAVAIIKIYDYRVTTLLAVERLRTRIATDLHDDIGASLTQISILSELARRAYAPQVLTDIANIAREVAQEMSDIVWAVNPRHDRFEGLVHRMRRFANDTLAGAEIDLVFKVEKFPADFSVPLDARRPLYLVFKEAVNNVARHSGARSAWIKMAVDPSFLKLTVADDGCGFDASQPHAGEGVASMQRRIREIGGTIRWEPRSGGGTSVVAALPLKVRTPLPELIGVLRRVRR